MFAVGPVDAVVVIAFVAVVVVIASSAPAFHGSVVGSCRVAVDIIFAVIVAAITSSCSGTVVGVRDLRGCIGVVRSDDLRFPYTERNYPVLFLSSGR